VTVESVDDGLSVEPERGRDPGHRIADDEARVDVDGPHDAGVGDAPAFGGDDAPELDGLADDDVGSPRRSAVEEVSRECRSQPCTEGHEVAHHDGRIGEAHPQLRGQSAVEVGDVAVVPAGQELEAQALRHECQAGAACQRHGVTLLTRGD
jgi:hypothetical protein